jgi:hypothetical protein
MKKSLIIIGVIILSCLLGLISLFAQPPESITITTYYPSPFGSYRELRANRLTVHPTRAMTANDGEILWGSGPWGKLITDNGASIQLGGSGTPYISFSNDAANYDANITLISNNRIVIDGVSVRSYDGRTSPGSIPTYVGSRAQIPGCIRFTFTSSSNHQECPSGYNIATAPMRPEDQNGNSVTSGTFLCCQTQ